MSLVKRIIKASQNKNTAIIDQSPVYKTREYYDTGNYILNGIFSGDIYKGVGSGMMYGIVGQQASGKTSIIMNVIKHFLENNPKGVVFFEESEGGNIDDFAKLKLSEEYRKRFITCDVVTLEDVIYETNSALNIFAEGDDPDEKLLIILDSLGSLTTKAEMEGIDSEDIKADAGRTQKLIKKLFRSVAQRLKRTGSTFLINGHVYDEIGAYMPTKKIAGGSGFLLLCTNIIMLQPKKLEDEETIVTTDKRGKTKKKKKKTQKGILVKCTARKSRFVAQDKTKAFFAIDFKGGLLKYSGIYEFLKENDMMKTVKRDKNYYQIPEIDFEFTAADLKEKGLKGVFGNKKVLDYVNEKFALMFKLGESEESKNEIEQEMLENIVEESNDDIKKIDVELTKAKEKKKKLQKNGTPDELRQHQNHIQKLYRDRKNATDDSEKV